MTQSSQHEKHDQQLKQVVKTRQYCPNVTSIAQFDHNGHSQHEMWNWVEKVSQKPPSYESVQSAYIRDMPAAVLTLWRLNMQHERRSQMQR